MLRGFLLILFGFISAILIYGFEALGVNGGDSSENVDGSIGSENNDDIDSNIVDWFLDIKKNNIV